MTTLQCYRQCCQRDNCYTFLVIRIESLWDSLVTLRGFSFQDISEREAGFEARDSGKARELVLVKAAIVVNSGDADLQHVVFATLPVL